jgi:asparagine synthetase B (glutamine-hydrolysing)
LLKQRGPDSIGQHQTLIESTSDAQKASTHVYATFLSTVLALRGSGVVEQPLRNDATGSVLCWNGEAWSISGDVVVGNDSQLVFSRLLEACTSSAEDSTRKIVELLSSIRGPYALVFYDAPNERIYYGRDCLGRRSLLRKSTPDGTLVLSSVCDNATGEAWSEVEADGIYMMNLECSDSLSSPSNTRIPHRRSGQDEEPGLFFVGKSSAT